MKRSNQFTRLKKAILLFFLILLGYLPSLLFFIWIDQNCHLPTPLKFLRFPWYSFSDKFSIVAQSFWNLLLILVFGVIHSSLAQPAIRQKLFCFVDEAAHRALYVIITGISVLWLIGAWQQSGIIIWRLLQDDRQIPILSEILFFTFMGFAIRTGMLLNAQNLSGLSPWIKSQTFQAQPHALIEKGLYRHCRHPIYLLTLCAIFITPEMTLDRLIVFLGVLLYLGVGIPVEERKLVREMGAPYLDYQNRVPSLLPRIGSRRSLDSI